MIDLGTKTTFRIRGRVYEITPVDIEKAAAMLSPGHIRRYRVLVGNHYYSPKALVAQATGLPLVAFTTAYAYAILSRLGFTIEPV